MTSHFETEKKFCEEFRVRLNKCLGYDVLEIDSLGKLSNIIDEKILISNKRNWIISDVHSAMKIIYEFYNPTVSIGSIFGYLSKDEDNYVVISNKIFSELIFNYMTSKIDTTIMSEYNVKSKFETVGGGLNIKNNQVKE